MTIEAQVADLLRADTTLMALLTGGVYTDEEVGVEGLRRGDDSPTEDAFDAQGILKPSAIVREGNESGYANIRDQAEQIVAVNVPVDIFLYQSRDKDTILAAKKRIYRLLEGKRLQATYPLMWAGDTPVFYDVGPVVNSTTIRQSWRCVYLKRPEA